MERVGAATGLISNRLASVQADAAYGGISVMAIIRVFLLCSDALRLRRLIRDEKSSQTARG
jgi:hypothetical protein